MILLDTNVLSELARPKPSSAVVEWMRHQGELAVSVISIEELTFGIARAPAGRRTKLSAWFEHMIGAIDRVLEVTEPMARACGELRAARQSSGRTIAQADALIAATALIHGLSLATRNVRDFDHCGVIVIDPFAA